MSSAEVEDSTQFDSCRSQDCSVSQQCVKKRKISTLRLYIERKNSIKSKPRSVYYSQQQQTNTVQSPFIEKLQQFVMSYITEKDLLKDGGERPKLRETQESLEEKFETCVDYSKGSINSTDSDLLTSSNQIKSILKKSRIEKFDAIKKVKFNKVNVILDGENQINQVETALSSLYSGDNCEPSQNISELTLSKPISNTSIKGADNYDNQSECIITAEPPKIAIEMVNSSNDTLVELQNMVDLGTVLASDDILFEPNHDTPDESNIDEICSSSINSNLTGSPSSIHTDGKVLDEQISIINDTIKELTYKKRLLKKKRHARRWNFITTWFKSDAKLPIDLQSDPQAGGLQLDGAFTQ